MVGIAFGVDDGKQAIGDILVSENLRCYEPERVGTHEVSRNSSRAVTGHACILLAPQPPEERRFEGGRGAPVRFGVVLTGEMLVDNLDVRRRVCALEPEAIGGEMEGSGLYAACQNEKVDWILVKAICDWADGDKRKAE